MAAPVFGRTMGAAMRLPGTPRRTMYEHEGGPAVDASSQGSYAMTHTACTLGELLAGFAEVPAALAAWPVTGLAADKSPTAHRRRRLRPARLAAAWVGVLGRGTAGGRSGGAVGAAL